MHDLRKTFTLTFKGPCKPKLFYDSRYILNFQQEHTTLVRHQSKLQATIWPTGDPLGRGYTL